MQHRAYSSPSEGQNRYSRHVSLRTQPVHLPYKPESRRRHISTTLSPFSTLPSSQSPMRDSSNKSFDTPRPRSKLSMSEEATALENIWGPLFGEGCHPTARLSQLLRGLAVHIIEELEPRHSIIITPAKMLRYYEKFGLKNELYPWSTVFDRHSSISRMYRELGCQHHLVQEEDNQAPNIPGLTPIGFEKWVILLIRTCPEQEYRRLQKAILSMPISNPDTNERFPKDISRRLFPQYEDLGIREHIEYAITKHADIQLPWSLTRERPDSNGGTLFHKFSAGKEICNPQTSGSRRVSFVLPPNAHSDTAQGFDKPAYKGAENARRQRGGDTSGFRDSPRGRYYVRY